MSFIVLNKVLNSAGDSVQIELHRDNVRCIEPVLIRQSDSGLQDIPDRRRVGAQSRVHTSLPGLAYVDVLESAAMIRRLITGTPESERRLVVSTASMESAEGLTLVDTKDDLQRKMPAGFDRL